VTAFSPGAEPSRPATASIPFIFVERINTEGDRRIKMAALYNARRNGTYTFDFEYGRASRHRSVRLVGHRVFSCELAAQIKPLSGCADQIPAFMEL